MKRAITFIISSLILLIIQSSPAYDLIRITLGAKPDLLLIFLVFLSFRYGSFEGIIYGFFIGIMQDIVSSSTFGSYAIIFLNIGLFVGLFSGRIFIKQIAAGIFVTLIGYLIKVIALFFIMSIYADLSSVAVLMRSELFIGLPLTVILSSPLFILFEKIAPIVYDKSKIHVDDSTKTYEE